MTEALITWFRSTLPAELSENSLRQLKVLDATEPNFSGPLCSLLLGHEQNETLKDVEIGDFPTWAAYLRHRLQMLLRSEDKASRNVESEYSNNLHLLFL